MDESKRLMITGWIDKASNHLDVAQEYLKSRCRASDAIQESQVCVELSVKSVLTILGIDFPKTHGWGEKELRKIAEDIQNRRLLVRLKDQSFHIRLPRLLILVNFWEQFYIQAKYGIEAGNLAPAQSLFAQAEAELAVAHADECLNAANNLRFAAQDRLTAVLS